MDTPSNPLSPEQRALLALHLVPGLGPRLIAALLKRFGSAQATLRATSGELQQVPHIGTTLASQFRAALDAVDVEGELALAAQHQVRLLFHGNDGYPPSLVEIPGAPRIIYLRGKLLSSDSNAVGIVGSRRCSAYGLRVATRLGQELARAGWVVVSGLARGIDGAAHKGALQGGGRTIAVLANGLTGVYPPEHAKLAEEVASSGAVLTEASMKMEPLPGMFPARNRIISGLSRGVVIVEADVRSGALITAEHALEQGREVFAIPGPVDSASSAGTLQLIRQGARLVRSAEDILEDLQGIAPIVPDALPLGPPPDLDPLQTRIWEFLAEQPRHADEITRHLELPVTEVSRHLMLLEMRHVLRRLPGNRYERC